MSLVFFAAYAAAAAHNNLMFDALCVVVDSWRREAFKIILRFNAVIDQSSFWHMAERYVPFKCMWGCMRTSGPMIVGSDIVIGVD